MHLKIIFGIAIPLLIMVSLAILGSVSIGFSITEDYLDQITTEKLFVENSLVSHFQVGTITIENSYFLPRRYSLPALSACMIDTQNVKPPIDGGSVYYNEGDYDSKTGKILDSSYSYKIRGGRSVEIPSEETIEVGILIEPSYSFRYNKYNELIAQYREYDTLIIFENDRDNYKTSYMGCQNLKPELEGAVRIPIAL